MHFSFFSSWSSCFWEAALWAPVQLTEPSRRPYATQLRVGSNPLWLSLLHRQHHSICHLKVTYTGRLRLSVCVRKLNYFRAVAPLSFAPYRLCSSPCSPEGTVRHSSMWPWSRRRTSPPIRKPKRKQRVRIFVFLLNEWRWKGQIGGQIRGWNLIHNSPEKWQKSSSTPAILHALLFLKLIWVFGWTWRGKAATDLYISETPLFRYIKISRNTCPNEKQLCFKQWHSKHQRRWKSESWTISGRPTKMRIWLQIQNCEKLHSILYRGVILKKDDWRYCTLLGKI